MGLLTSIATNVFGGSSIMMYVVMGLGVALLISAGVVKYEMSKNDEQLQVITAMKISDAAQKAAIAQLQADSQAIQDINANLNSVETADQQQAMKLAQTLAKLDAAAIAHPDMVEKAINKASLERNRCIALITGAAKLKGEKNSVCPQVLERK